MGAQLRYDNEGQLAHWQSSPSSPGSTDDSLYDGEGNRVEQQSVSGATTTTTVYVGSLEQDTTTQSANGSSSTRTQFYYANGQRLAVSTNGTLFSLASEGLGSTQLALDSSGTPMGSQLYAPYGTTRYSNGTMPLDYGFTGQHSDSVTGLAYYNARYYDLVAGQFASADSVLAGLNRYAYVAGNPETYSDPSGHVECIGGECETGGGGDPENAGGGDFVAGDVADASLAPLEQSQVDAAVQQMEAGEVDAGWQETGTGIDLPDAGVNDAIDSATTEGERTANAEFNTRIGSDQTEAPSTSVSDVIDSTDVRIAQEGETKASTPTEPTEPDDDALARLQQLEQLRRSSGRPTAMVRATTSGQEPIETASGRPYVKVEGFDAFEFNDPDGSGSCAELKACYEGLARGWHGSRITLELAARGQPPCGSCMAALQFWATQNGAGIDVLYLDAAGGLQALPPIEP